MTLSIVILFVCNSALGQTNIFKVALDAGHGAKDYGAVYDGHIEKNIALAVVLKVGKLLNQTKGVDVIYTRKTDVFIDLIERANIANRADANIFVSIHCNANRNTLADGTETYVMGMTKVASNLEAAKKENSVITLEKDYKQKYEGFDPNSPETIIGMTLMQEEYLDNSISLASKIEDEFSSLGKKIRGGGVKQAPFMVLHKAYMPRVLVEMGFISNPREGSALDSEDGQNEIAQSIVDAIISYKKEYFGNGTTENYDSKPSRKSIEVQTKKDTATPAQSKIVSETPSPKNVTTNQNAMGTVFKVQISASSKKVELIPKNFRGLKNTSLLFENNIYKYLYGESSDYNEVKKELIEAKAKGYSSSFIVAFKNGKKISIQEALRE
jgi:N-acetylmuramoyl-L-alanine amidase